MPKGPPAYAWDWFARQRLLWREARKRLLHPTSPVSARYAAATAKPDVLALLRADYAREPAVRAAVDRAVAELAFLGRTGVPFERLGVTTPPRGMRWWWTALTGEEVASSPPPAAATRVQLTLDDVHEGYGD